MAVYDINATDLICDAEPITGYSTDGGVVIAPVADATTPSVGADGRTVVSKSNNKDAVATVTLQQGSPGAIKLGSLLSAQDADESSEMPTFVFEYTNPTTGEEVSSDAASIQGRPEIIANATSADAVYVVYLPGAYKTASFGETAA